MPSGSTWCLNHVAASLQADKGSGPVVLEELEVVDGVLGTVEEAVQVILKEGPAAAMNRFNRKPEEEKD